MLFILMMIFLNTLLKIMLYILFSHTKIYYDYFLKTNFLYIVSIQYTEDNNLNNFYSHVDNFNTDKYSKNTLFNKSYSQEYYNYLHVGASQVGSESSFK